MTKRFSRSAHRVRRQQRETNTSRDLRTENFDYTASVPGGDIFLKGNVIQAFWYDSTGVSSEIRKETWTCPTHQQALENFNDMKERWS